MPLNRLRTSLRMRQPDGAYSKKIATSPICYCLKKTTGTTNLIDFIKYFLNKEHFIEGVLVLR